ncbi:hypothetical protein LL3_01925 [Bacillus amyloliquefaciens LL3]|nr:hypothetical protein LL3_01925 [Bacillus amyloliquefaciens LL3]
MNWIMKRKETPEGTALSQRWADWWRQNKKPTHMSRAKFIF